MTYISPHITLSEATKSQAAVRHRIDNTPDYPALLAMRLVASKVFEPLREHFKVPLGISSFYRCARLNRLVGGASGSQHVKGEAIDIDADIYGGVTNAEIFEWIKNNLEFDQLIWEFGDTEQPAWVHVSYRAEGNRNMVLYIK